MLRLAVLSSRGRLGTFTGALLAFFAASVIAMAWGMQLESILRTHPPVERYAGAAAVVAAHQTVGADHDVLLGERARVSAALVARLAAVPGVRAAIGDVSVRARLGGLTAVAHGWGSAALTPYVLRAGRAARAARRGRRRLSRAGWCAAAPGVDGALAHRHRCRRRAAAARRFRAERDLPDRRRGDTAGRPSGAGRRGRCARRTRLRRLAPARGRRRRPGAHRRRAR